MLYVFVVCWYRCWCLLSVADVVVCCLLFVVCSSLFAVCCLLFADCGLLLLQCVADVRCLLFVGWCVLMCGVCW